MSEEIGHSSGEEDQPHMEEEREVLRDANGQVLDETKSVKVGLDREELMAEFAILAEEEKEEEERAQAVFVEAVENLKLYSQLDLETISRLLSCDLLRVFVIIFC
jgi:tryptophan synthase beta subunit